MEMNKLSFNVAAGIGYTERYVSVLACLCVCGSLFVPTWASSMDVYKIVLKQGKSRQFVQYDVDAPSLKKFTSCVWLRIYDVSNEAPLFAYRAVTDSGVDWMIAVWLEAGGRQLRVGLPGNMETRGPVSWSERVWHRLCFSWDTGAGAFAAFLDGLLVLCEAGQQLLGYDTSGNGKISISNGLDSEGYSSGFNGEVYGFSMIWKSIFESMENYSSSQMPNDSSDFNLFEQKPDSEYTFLQNENLFEDDEFMNDYKVEQSANNIMLSYDPRSDGRSFIEINTPASEVRHSVGKYSTSNPIHTLHKQRYNYGQVKKWKTKQDTSNASKRVRNVEIIQDECCAPSVDENIEFTQMNIPPGLNAMSTYDTMAMEKPLRPYINDIECKTKDIFGRCVKDTMRGTKQMDKTEKFISEVETPPPKQNSSQVYGQWTSHDAYKKLFNRPSKNKQIPFSPPTIPLVKYSDESPYASNMVPVRLIPPLSISQYITPKKSNIMKRDTIHGFIDSDSIDYQDFATITDVEITHRGTEYVVDDSTAKSKGIDSEYFASSIVPKGSFNQNFFSMLPHVDEIDAAPNHRKTNEVSSKFRDLQNFNNSCSLGHRENMDPAGSNNLNSNTLKFPQHPVTVNRLPNINEESARYTPFRTKLPSAAMPVKIKINHHMKKAFHKDFENLLDQLIGKYSTTQTKNAFTDRSKNMHDDFRYSADSVLNDRRQNSTSSLFMKWIKLGNALGENFITAPQIKKASSILEDSDNSADTFRYRTGRRLIGKSNIYFPQPTPHICLKWKKISNQFNMHNAGVALIKMASGKCSVNKGTSLFDDSDSLINWTDTPIRLLAELLSPKELLSVTNELYRSKVEIEKNLSNGQG